MIVDCQSLTCGYGRKAVAHDVSFSLRAGEICAVVGHNGAGKSTFIKTLLGLQPPLSGGFDWYKDALKKCAYLGQRGEFDGQFPIRVRDMVMMGAWHGLGFWSHIDDDKKAKVEQALAQTNLQHMADRPVFECSSGQLQRCFFARAIVQDAPLILLDEPFTAIDQATQANLIEIIKGWREQGRGLVIVLHDLSAVKGLCDTVLLLGKGRSLFGTSDEVLTTKNLLDYGYLSQMQADWMTDLARGM